MPIDEKSFNDFMSEFKQFQGRMDEFKNTSERRFNENGLRLTAIELRLATQPVCLFHNATVETVKALTDRNLDQDQKINDVEKKVDVMEFKLNPREKMQLNFTTFFSAIIALWEAIKFMYKIP